MNGRKLIVFAMVLAGICLFRVLTVVADDEIEVYSSVESGHALSEDGEAKGRPEIRLTRPDEAESRIAREEGYDLVPGAEKLWGQEQNTRKDEISVPKRTDRKIASEPVEAQKPPVSTAEISPETSSKLPGVIEPTKPFTTTEAKARAEDLHPETIAASNKPVVPSYGLQSEPRPNSTIDPPVQSRAGVQEISLIVSDYGYFPNRLFVTQNMPVKIYLTTPSKVTMCLMLDEFGLKKGVSPGRVDELSFVPDRAGEFRFYCPVKSIEGKITVREVPQPVQSVRGLATEIMAPEPRRASYEPKNSTQLRALIGD